MSGLKISSLRWLLYSVACVMIWSSVAVRSATIRAGAQQDTASSSSSSSAVEAAASSFLNDINHLNNKMLSEQDSSSRHHQPDQQQQLAIERLRKLLELMAREREATTAAADEVDEAYEKDLVSPSSSFDDNSNLKFYTKYEEAPYFVHKKSAPKRIFIGKRQQRFPMFVNDGDVSDLQESLSDLLREEGSEDQEEKEENNEEDDESSLNVDKKNSRRHLFLGKRSRGDNKRSGHIQRIFIGKRGEIKRIFIG